MMAQTIVAIAVELTRRILLMKHENVSLEFASFPQTEMARAVEIPDYGTRV